MALEPWERAAFLEYQHRIAPVYLAASVFLGDLTILASEWSSFARIMAPTTVSRQQGNGVMSEADWAEVVRDTEVIRLPPDGPVRLPPDEEARVLDIDRRASIDRLSASIAGTCHRALPLLLDRHAIDEANALYAPGAPVSRAFDHTGGSMLAALRGLACTVLSHRMMGILSLPNGRPPAENELKAAIQAKLLTSYDPPAAQNYTGDLRDYLVKAAREGLLRDAKAFPIPYPVPDAGWDHIGVQLDREEREIQARLEKKHKPKEHMDERDPTTREFKEADPRTYVFRLEGGMWRLKFDSEETLLSEYDGLDYIWQLIRARGSPLSAIDLMGNRARQPQDAQKPWDSRSIRSSDELPQFEKESVSEGTSIETLDAQARDDLEEEIRECGENIAQTKTEIEAANGRGDEPAAERLTRDELHPEQEKLRKLLKRRDRDIRPGGRSQRLDQPPIQRARQTVRKAISRVIDKIRNANMPRIAAHLTDAIPDASDGSFVYRPTSLVDWQT